MAAVLWFLLPSIASASFSRDVLASRQPKNRAFTNTMNDQLLAKAIPLSEYMAEKQDGQGKPLHFTTSSRQLEENDDFYVDYDDRYSFSGYSLKYATCQPVQYFSSEAIAAGEHSPMITEDIVIMRLCPQSSCSSSAQYGCHYNYAEYALAVGDYVQIMLKYKAKHAEQLCEWCAECGVVYQGSNDDDAAAADDAVQRRLEDQAEEEAQADDDGGANDAQDDQANQNDDANQANDDGGCYNMDSICSEYDDVCGNDDDDNGYVDYEGYLDYLNCAEVEYNGYAYFVRPRCDGYAGTIKMAVYYDNYCGSYAGQEISVKDLGLGFRESIFNDFYAGSCVDCSESDAAPFYNLNSGLCNRLHASSAKCTSDLLYDVVDTDNDESSECSFIESLRFGTYDEKGKLTSGSSMIDWDTEVSPGQKALLGVSAFLCFFFIVYACYLHHSMTNLLIKSLSHRELLPPGRHRNRRSNSSRGGEDDYKLV